MKELIAKLITMYFKSFITKMKKTIEQHVIKLNEIVVQTFNLMETKPYLVHKFSVYGIRRTKILYRKTKDLCTKEEAWSPEVSFLIFQIFV